MDRVLHWVSFADDEQCRGVCFLLAHDVPDAAREAHRLGINPGGEVLAFPIPIGSAEASAVRETCLANMNRLIQVDELSQLIPGLVKLGDAETEAAN